MKIARPVDQHDPARWLRLFTRRISAEAMVRRLERAHLPVRWFYRKGPRIYSETQRQSLVDGNALKVVARPAWVARQMAERAAARGYSEEACALHITSARLVQRTKVALSNVRDIPNVDRMILDAFFSLGLVETFPADDAPYWQDRYSEVVAALLPRVAAYPHEGVDALKALTAVTKVAHALRLVPYRGDSDARPMSDRFYSGGPARVHIALAHVELMGQRGEAALARLAPCIERGISERDDLFYALMIAIAASRRVNRPDLHQQYVELLHLTVDSLREEYQSVEGRLFNTQLAFSEMRYAIEPWSMNVHHGEDLLGMAEIFKARLLLDELSGCRVESPRVTPDFERYADESPAEPIGRPERDRLQAQFTAEIGKLSHFPVGSGLETANPIEDRVHHSIHNETKERLAASEPEAIARGGRFAGSVRPVPPKDLRSSLQEDELLVEFVMPRNAYQPNRDAWIIAATSQQVDVRHIFIDAISPPTLHKGQGQLFERGPLSDDAATARAAIDQGDDAKARPILRKLFDYLIRPVIEMGHEPENYRQWILVLHGPLHLVPMSALIDESGRHLVERVALVSSPSATIWHRSLHALPRPLGHVLAVGNASDPYELRFAEEEVTRVSQLLSQLPASTVLTRQEANSDSVRREMTRAEVIHFATHGLLDPRDPLNGHRIPLTASGDDGMLRARDVRQMKLERARLVVLNICDGAVCRYGPGDEPLGLLSAFLAAGAENVLGGIWELRDAHAKEFMLAFYQALSSTLGIQRRHCERLRCRPSRNAGSSSPGQAMS